MSNSYVEIHVEVKFKTAVELVDLPQGEGGSSGTIVAPNRNTNPIIFSWSKSTINEKTIHGKIFMTNNQSSVPLLVKHFEKILSSLIESLDQKKSVSFKADLNYCYLDNYQNTIEEKVSGLSWKTKPYLERVKDDFWQGFMTMILPSLFLLGVIGFFSQGDFLSKAQYGLISSGFLLTANSFTFPLIKKEKGYRCE